MAVLAIYGASDDLIEVDGLLSDELNPPYGKPAVVNVNVDDASFARVVIDYDHDGDGEWRIPQTWSQIGTVVTVVKARGEDEPDDDHGCPGYSDKAVIDVGDIEARRFSISVSELV